MADTAGNSKLSGDQLKTIIAGVVFAALAGFGYFKYLWQPYAARKADGLAKITDINSRIAKAKGTAGRLDALNRELKELSLREQDAEKRLPKGKKVPDLLRTVMNLSRYNAVTINSFSSQGAKDLAYHSEVRYIMQVTGNYHALGRFLAALATSQRLFAVRDLNVRGADSGNSSASFVLIAYQYKG